MTKLGIHQGLFGFILIIISMPVAAGSIYDISTGLGGYVENSCPGRFASIAPLQVCAQAAKIEQSYNSRCAKDRPENFAPPYGFVWTEITGPISGCGIFISESDGAVSPVSCFVYYHGVSYYQQSGSACNWIKRDAWRDIREWRITCPEGSYYSNNNGAVDCFPGDPPACPEGQSYNLETGRCEKPIPFYRKQPSCPQSS